jgi:hypothetical protein
MTAKKVIKKSNGGISKSDFKKEISKIHTKLDSVEKRLDTKIDSKIDSSTQNLKDYIDSYQSQNNQNFNKVFEKLDHYTTMLMHEINGHRSKLTNHEERITKLEDKVQL